jgi:hypothetical protein
MAPLPAAIPAVPTSVVLTPKRASQASSAASETTTTFDLTHKRDKSNLSMKNRLKTDISIKSNPRLVISNNLHSRKIMLIDACAYIPMFILLMTYSMAGQKLCV